MKQSRRMAPSELGVVGCASKERWRSCAAEEVIDLIQHFGNI